MPAKTMKPAKAMKIVNCLNLIAFLALTFPWAGQNSVEYGWQAQSSSALSKLNAVHFIDRQRGWVGGNNGVLLSTEDGGASWKRIPLPESERREPLLDLWRFDSVRGCLIGEYDMFDRHPSVEWTKKTFLLRKLDVVNDWEPGELITPKPKPPQPTLSSKKSEKESDKTSAFEALPDPVLLRLFFASDQIGWACGELGTIQKTRNGGASWQTQSSPSRKILYDITGIDYQQAWIVGAGGLALRTVDGGQIWAEQPTNVNSALKAVHFVDTKRGWAVGNDGTILLTINGGNRWQKIDSGTTRNLNDVFFVNAREGWIAGDRGMLLHTTDGGSTWKDESFNTHANLNRLFFIAPDCGWAVGSSGFILKYGLIENASRPALTRPQ